MARILILLTLVISSSLGWAAGLPRPDMTLTPDILDAFVAMSAGNATEAQAALLFKNNDKINGARLNEWISDNQYQTAQRDYALRNQEFAKQAADMVVGEGNFIVQTIKPDKAISAGTDSDYIIKNVTDPAQVTIIQQVYNQRVDEFLQQNGLLDQPATNWHNKLDVDFMAHPDPLNRTPEQFQQVAALENAAYSRQLAAEYEAISRSGFNESVTPDHTLAYVQEMQDQIHHRQEMLNALRDPDSWSDPAFKADIYRQMALEQKYAERIESLTDNCGSRVDLTRFSAIRSAGRRTVPTRARTPSPSIRTGLWSLRSAR